MIVYALIPLFPLSAFALIALLASRLKGRSHLIAVPAIVFAFALSVFAFVEVILSGPIEIPLYTWFHSGGLTMRLGLSLDPLSVLVLLLVSGVSACVHLYSVRYMQGDPRYARFFAVIALFSSAMLLLVMSTNLLMLYMSWEVMGLCSYLLISHWAERPSACEAATKAFLVNAVADIGLGLGVLTTLLTFGTLDIREILRDMDLHVGESVNLLGWIGLDGRVSVLTVITLLFFLGACGKSAQLPLHVWLPFAMEAPTPVSALIHAATMVNAGIFLMLRLSPLIAHSPTALTVILVMGTATALFAALIAMTQTDIKRILAYSTMSQLGFMMMACGAGAFTAALFHLLSHGALKAFLFLSTGNALTAAAAAHRSPADRHTHPGARPWSWRLTTGTVLLSWLPVLVIFAGPYEALWRSTGGIRAGVVFWCVGLATTFLAAYHVSRGALEGFQVGTGSSGHQARSSNPADRFTSLTLLGMVVVTGLAVGGAFTLLWNALADFLAPVVGTLVTPSGAQADSPTLLTRLLVPLAIGLAGWGMAHAVHLRSWQLHSGLAEWRKTLYVTLLNKGYVDELYSASLVQPLLRSARWVWQAVELGILERLVTTTGRTSIGVAQWLWRIIDVQGIDRAVEGSASLMVRLAQWLWQAVDVRGLDRGVDRGADLTVTFARWLWGSVDVRGLDRTVQHIAEGSDAAGRTLRRVEPRMLEHHLTTMIFWLTIMLALFYLLLR